VAACLGAIAFGILRPFHSTREIGLALREAGPDDRVVLLEHFWFDVPVYARLRRPVIVLDDWSDADARRHDNWRKELADAGRFDPAAAKATLLPLADAGRILCSPATTWVVGEAQAAGRFPMLARTRPIAAQRDLRVWRLDAATAHAPRPGCAETAAPAVAPQP
jgi:hypothetical protein